MHSVGTRDLHQCNANNLLVNSASTGMVSERVEDFASGESALCLPKVWHSRKRVRR